MDFKAIFYAAWNLLAQLTPEMLSGSHFQKPHVPSSEAHSSCFLHFFYPGVWVVTPYMTLSLQCAQRIFLECSFCVRFGGYLVVKAGALMFMGLYFRGGAGVKPEQTVCGLILIKAHRAGKTGQDSP